VWFFLWVGGGGGPTSAEVGKAAADRSKLATHNLVS